MFKKRPNNNKEEGEHNNEKKNFYNKNLENKNLSYLKDLLLQSDPSFSEKNWNFNSFKEFIKCLFNKEIETSYDQTKRYEYISKVTF
jgi:hypothetical protein